MRLIHQLTIVLTLTLCSGLSIADNHTAGEQGATSDQTQVVPASQNPAGNQNPTESVTSGVENATVAAQQKERTPDIRTIIDISGSMKKTDPNNLRAPAMRLLVDLLPKDSKSGVWTFGQYVNMLVKHRVIDDGWKKEAKEKSNEISSVGLFTNIGESLNTAGYDLDRLNPEYEPFFILLTDGMVDVDKDPEVNKKEQERILKELVPKFVEAGVKLHTIALSDKADQDFLQQLSLSTGGMSTVAENSDELLKAYVRLFDQSVPSEEVPLNDNKFLIDSSIEEFTALIFRKEGSEATQLVAPDESVITAKSNDPDVTWHTDEKYDLITVKRPYEGEWILQAEADPDNRVTVVSDLTLELDELPPTIFSGEEINIHAWFDSADGQVKEPEFLSLLTGSLQLTNEAGKSIQKEIAVQSEGEFQHAFYEKIRNLRRPGEFEIAVLVDGKTFKRQRSHRIEVLEPFAYDVSYDGVGDESIGLVSATPLLSGLDLEKTKVIAQIKGPDDSSLIASAELQLSQDGQRWLVQVIPNKGSGNYRVSLDLRLVLETGKEFRIKPKPFDLTLPHFPEGYIEPEPEPAPEEEKIEPVIEEQELSLPEQTTTVAEQMPVTEPKPEEPEEDSLFTIIMLAVLALVAGILGFLFYKLRSHKKVQEEINDEQAAADVVDDDMQAFSELDSGELDQNVEESAELSEQVDAVREELERMGSNSDDEDDFNSGDDTPPELEQDELVSALDELAGNATELDADDMVEDDMSSAEESADDADMAGAFAAVEEDTSIEASIDEELDALLEETESELDQMMETGLDESSIPTLEAEPEAAEAPELEVDFDNELEVPAPDEEVSSEDDISIDDLLDAEDEAQEDAASVEDLMDEVMNEAEASKLEEDIAESLTEAPEEPSFEEMMAEETPQEAAPEEVPIEEVPTVEIPTVEDAVEDAVEDEFIEESEGELLESELEEGEEAEDDFGDSIDQALDELLAATDEAPEASEEFDIDDLDDIDAELDELTKDLEAEISADSGSDDVDDLDALLGEDSAPSEEVDDLDALLSEDTEDPASDAGQDALEAALGELDAASASEEDALSELEDISLDELNAEGDDGDVDIDRIMAEIDAEAIRQNQMNKDSE